MAEPIALKKDFRSYKVILEMEVIGEFMHARVLADRLLEILKIEVRARPLFYQIKNCTLDVPGMYD